jgi:hypothetical protein
MTLPKAIAYGLPTTTVGATAIDAVAVTVTALTGFFPTLSAGEYFYAVLCSDQNMSDPDINYETVKVTAIDDSDPFVLTVVRNQESTDGAKVWPDGTYIACLGTAIAHDDMVAAISEGNFTATATPTVTDDETDGYSAGSMWIVDNEHIYICVDATEGAAVWQFVNKTIPEPPPAPALTDQTATAVTVTGEAGTEVRLDDGTWYDSPHEFTGLDSNTSYTAYARYAATTTQWPSFAGEGTAFKTWFRYGFRITKAESNTSDRVTYLHDAVGMTPAYMDFGTSFDYGDWGDFVEEINRPVMLKYDGTVDYEMDHADQTKKIDGSASDVANTSYAGNAMSEFKLLYVYRYEDVDYEYVIFSDGPYDSNYEAYAHTDATSTIKDAFYFAMYEGTYVGTRLRSIGTGSVMASQTATTEITRAEANGTGAGEGGGNVDGYWTITKSQWDFVNDLLVLISKSTDTQTAFGNGNSYSGSYLAAGTLKATGQFYGYSSTSAAVKVFYIENVLWGNYWMRMAGILMALDGEILAKMTPDYPTPSGDTVSTTGFTESGVTPTGGSGGYTKTVEITDIGYIPSDNTGGSASTYWCDGLWYTIGSTVKYARVGGSRTGAGLCGGRTVNLGSPASSTHTNGGSALSFL